MDLDDLLAREAIRDLVARYNAGADGGRFDEVAALFAEDAVLEVPGERFEGRDQIVGLFRRTQGEVRAAPVAAPAGGPRQYVRHFTATLQIDVEDRARARSRCYFQVLMAHGLDHWGRYVDEFRREGDRWLFAHRRVTVDGRRPDGSAWPG